jgi:hypothetical protein
MSNRIRHVTMQHRRVSPAEADLLVIVEADRVDTGTELRGTLIGPKCPGVETVQIAYKLRSAQRPDQPHNSLAGRIVIPEPNLWTSETPFIYDGTVELWQDGERCDNRAISTLFKQTSLG